MNKIASAKKLIDDKRASIAALQAELSQQIAERHRLSGKADAAYNPDTQARLEMLNKTIDQLYRTIPKRRYASDEAKPSLQVELERLEADFARLHQERENVVTRINGVKTEAAKWDGKLTRLAENYTQLAEMCSQSGVYPPGETDRTLRGKAIWARDRQAELDSLPILLARLDEYGQPDPAYRPEATEPDNLDRAFYAANYGTPGKLDEYELDRAEAEATRLYRQG